MKPKRPSGDSRGFIRLSLDLSRPMFNALQDRATQAGQTKSALVRSALFRELKEDMNKPQKKDG
jgi:hypothetical protein